MKIPKKYQNQRTFDKIEYNPRKSTNKKGKPIVIDQYKAIFAFKRADGEWETLTKSLPHPDEARDWIRDRIREHENKGTTMEHRGMTLRDYAENVYKPDFLEELASARTEKQYIDTAVKFFGDTELEAIKPIQLRRYKKHLQTTSGKVRKDGTPIERGFRTVNAYLVRLRALLNQAAADEVIKSAPSFKKLIDTAKETPRSKTIKADEHERLLKACDVVKGGRDRSHLKLVLIGLHELGCRRVELHQILVRDIDLASGIVWVWEAKRKVRVQRQTPITDSLREAIEHYRIMDMPSDARVFGEYQDFGSWETAKKLAGVDMDLNLNDYRHTALTNAHEAKVSSIDIKNWYGHSTKSKITDTVYINPRTDYIREEIAKVNEYMRQRRQSIPTEGVIQTESVS